MGMESFSTAARTSLVDSFIEDDRKDRELAAKNANASQATKRRMAARELQKRKVQLNRCLGVFDVFVSLRVSVCLCLLWCLLLFC